ncbi:MAG: 3-phosphoshikimate 1-carboxyvinyltransferase [Planctomycetota bacterium]|nr:MAG: 3-phosphoshikimate 1-carboxyvinyltransferase [Planctomycetota bacterium]
MSSSQRRIERRGADVIVHATGAVRGVVRPPGSKSLTNRALVCAALAEGESTLRGASCSDDALLMIDGLRSLGIRIEHRDGAVRVRGCRGFLPRADVDLDAGNAGTVMRFLTALATLGNGRYRIDGSERMRARPIGDLVHALQSLGAGIGFDQQSGYPPLTMASHGLTGGTVVFERPPSSQFLSALLMVAPYAANDVMIEVRGALPSRPYVDMTLAVMRAFGVESLAAADAPRFIVPSGQRYCACVYDVEPDASAATYFWSAAAITGGDVTVSGLPRDSLQGDTSFVDVLERMGCAVNEPASGLRVVGPQTGSLRGVDANLNEMPDTVQTLAVAALFADAPTTIRDVANLRVKETDRLAALAAELPKLGAHVELLEDGLIVHPAKTLRPARIATYDDHRMAMSFALAGLRVDGVVIADAECVSKSVPDFFELLDSLGSD